VSTAIDPVAAFRAELHRAARRQIARRRRRRLALLAAIVAAALTTGLSIAGTGWLSGEPAPNPVVEDFKAYTPQLGFHPEPGKAVFVAEDGVIKLYATTNREGTYCLVVDEPWKPATAGDGGTCVLHAQAAFPITAGTIGAGPARGGGQTWVVAGRVADPQARSVRFGDPNGEAIERTLGSSGFFVAAVHASEGCPARDWVPTFTALAADNEPLREAKILLIKTYPGPGRMSCGGGVAPHGPYDPNK
jgi:hypothetical protein